MSMFFHNVSPVQNTSAYNSEKIAISISLSTRVIRFWFYTYLLFVWIYENWINKKPRGNQQQGTVDCIANNVIVVYLKWNSWKSECYTIETYENTFLSSFIYYECKSSFEDVCLNFLMLDVDLFRNIITI